MSAQKLAIVSLLISNFAAISGTPRAEAAAARLGSVYAREVAVPAVGWVRVPLDLTTIRHLGPLGRDLRVVDPTERNVVVAIEEAPHELTLRPVRLVEVVREANQDGGWSLVLDVGEGAPAHERLRFDLAKLVAAPAVRLESGPDGSRWQLLAEGDLFRLADPTSATAGSKDATDRLAATTLSYPATTDRFLRLSWPATAGFPEVRTIEVETSPGPSIEVSTADVRCDRRGESTESTPLSLSCRIAMPAAGQLVRRITLEMEGRGAIAYRFLEPLDGHFEALAEGIWPRSATKTRHAVELGASGRRIAGDFLRLDLHGTAPQLAGVRVEISLPEAVFYAQQPGRYELRYGSITGTGTSSAVADLADDAAARLSADPERETPAPPLPPVAGPGKALRLEKFPRSWEVLAPGLVPGEVVRLEIPGEVYAATRGALGRLRLAVGRRQIPYVLSPGRAPVLAAETFAAVPEPDREGRVSRFEIALPEPWLPLSQIEITSAAGPLRREVSLRSLGPRGPNAEVEARSLGSQLWSCDSSALLPCRLAIALDGSGAGSGGERIDVRIDDGDDPPLSVVDVAIYRKRAALVFVWPNGGAQGGSQSGPKSGRVRLLVGGDEVGAPDYDLTGVAEDLLGRPWYPAEIAPILAPQGSKVGKWILPAALALAALGLVLLLRRILASAD